MNRFGKRRSRVGLAIPAAVLALLTVPVLALAACGGGAASGTTPPAATPAAAGPNQTQTPGATTSRTLPPPGGTSMAVSYAEPPYPPAKAIAAGTTGWKFKPTVDIAVTELGCYDEDQDGLARSHRVGIFDARNKRLLASVTVGRGSSLDGAFRWEPLEVRVVLKAGRSYLVGTHERPVEVNNEETLETLYDEEDAWPPGKWAPEIAFSGLRTNLGADRGFSAPANPRRLWAMIRVAWMSPNFKFRPVAASLPTSRVPSRELMGGSHYSPSGPPPLLVLSDGAYRWDAPGSASSAQAQAVARRYIALLSSGGIPGAGLYTAQATCDFWGAGRQVKGATNIQRAHRQLAQQRDRAWSWGRRYHLLAAPGVAVCEGMYKGSNRHVDPPPDPAPYLVVLAVDGDKIAHEEIFSGPGGRPVMFYDSAPRPGDTAQVAAQVGAALCAAFASRDRATLMALLATDVLFRDVTYRTGARGREALPPWWATLAPARTVIIKNRAPIAGPGWAVVRWTARRFYKNGFLPNGVDESRNGATVIEVRDGKVVRMTLYLEPGEGGEASILQEHR